MGTWEREKRGRRHAVGRRKGAENKHAQRGQEGTCTEWVGGQIKEAIHVYREDSDKCVSRRRFLMRSQTDTISPVKETEKQEDP